MPSYKIYKHADNREAGVAVSSTTTYYSDSIAAVDGQAISFHLEWSGTPTGVFTLWYSNKAAPAVATDTDWVQDTTWVPTNPAGAASKGFYTVGNLTGQRVRLKYVNASGSGTLSAWSSIARG